MYQFYEKLSARKPTLVPKKTIPSHIIKRQIIPMMKSTKEIEDIKEATKIAEEKIPEEKKIISLPNGVSHDSKGKFTSLNPSSSSVRKAKKPEWDETYELVSVNPPVPFTHPRIRKRFFITFVYKKNGEVHKKTVKFGKVDQSEYIDHKDKEVKDKLIKSMKAYHNPFKSNHWRFHLLNQCTEIKDAYMKYLTEKNLF